MKQLLLEKSPRQVDLTTTCLLFDEEQLDDDSKKLSDYDVQQDSWLELTDPSFSGRSELCFMGARFVDMSNESGVKVIGWSKTAPEWRRTGRGLCLEGVCYNKKYPANGKRVIMSLVYTKFDLLRDVDPSATKCPMCPKDPKDAVKNCF